MGGAIPLESRIICACDALEAMTSSRSYRSALPLEGALAELERCAGDEFDPDVVRVLVGSLGEEPANAEENPRLLRASSG